MRSNNETVLVLVSVQRVNLVRAQAAVANTRVGIVKVCRRACMSPPGSRQVAPLYVKQGNADRAGNASLKIANDDKQVDLAQAEVEDDAAQN